MSLQQFSSASKYAALLMDGDQGEDEGGEEWAIRKDQLTTETQNGRKRATEWSNEGLN